MNIIVIVDRIPTGWVLKGAWPGLQAGRPLPCLFGPKNLMKLTYTLTFSFPERRNDACILLVVNGTAIATSRRRATPAVRTHSSKRLLSPKVSQLPNYSFICYNAIKLMNELINSSKFVGIRSRRKRILPSVFVNMMPVNQRALVERGVWMC